VSLGAAITVLALAFEPFFQQSVSYPSRTAIIGSGTVSVATAYSNQETQIPIAALDTWTSGAQDAASRTLAAQIARTILDRNRSVNVAPSVCPTSRCSWRPYSSLGICHQCQDVSYLLVPVCQKESLNHPRGIQGVQNPCGHRLNDTLVTGVWGYFEKRAMGLSTMLFGKPISYKNPYGVFWNSTAFPKASSVLLGFYIGYVPGGEPQVLRNVTPVLKECVLQWCVRTYEASHNNGRLEEKVLSTYLPPDGESARSTTDDGLVLTAAGKAFSVGANVTNSMRFLLAANLPTSLDNQTLDSSGQYPGRWNFVQHEPHDVNTVLGPIAEMVSNDMRTATNHGTEQVSGDSWGPEPFVEVRWLWILLPASLMLGTFTLICATIFKSRKERVPLWKTSALATLLHGLAEDVRQSFGLDASPSEVEAIARKIRVEMSLKSTTGSLLPRGSMGGSI
jgi:hypothetical protein